jgi:hypothetical protein
MNIRDFSDEREFKNLRIKKSIFQEVGSWAYDNDLSLARCVETALCEWLDKQYAAEEDNTKPDDYFLGQGDAA